MRSVSVEVHTMSGYVYAFNDAASPNSGSTALTQIGSDSMIHSIGTDTDGEVNLHEIYIPFHAINYATVTVDNSLAAPVDDLCGSGSSLCDHETIEVWTPNAEAPFEWWDEDNRLILGRGKPTLQVYFLANGERVTNFTAVSSNPEGITATIGEYDGENAVILSAIGGGVVTVTVNFPDYGCEIAIKANYQD